MVDESSEDETPNDEEDVSHPARISCSLGALELEIEGETLAECERVFERIWEQRMDESSDMSRALRDRLVGHQ